MHIGVLTTAPVTTYGWGRYAVDVMSALSQQGMRFTIVTDIDAPDPTTLATQVPFMDTVEAYHRTLPSLTPSPRLSSLRLLMNAPHVHYLLEKCDLIHVIAEPYTLAAAASRLPLVVTAHGTYVPSTLTRPIFGGLYQRLYQRALIICVSSYTERQVQRALPSAHTMVIPNGVDAKRFARIGRLGDANTNPIILAVGQLKERKGFHVLIQALPLIHKAIPDARVVIVGSQTDAAYVERLQAEIQRLGLQEAVTLTGRVTDEELLDWYRRATVFALPALNVGAKFEGFGLVYMEASAAGLPVIGTRDCGAEDAILDGKTGYLVPQHDAQSVADRVTQLLGDPQRRDQLGQAGRLHAQDNTWDKQADRIIHAYKMAIGHGEYEIATRGH